MSIAMRRRPRSVQAGFSLLEAMVAVLVLSFGLLALAGFQLRSLTDSVGASNQNIAVQLAGSMADRIRANPSAGAMSGSPYLTGWTASPTAPSPSCTGASASCTATQLAAHDLWEWKRRVASSLPGGQADVQRRDAMGGLLFLHVAWDEPAVLHPVEPDPHCPPGKTCLELVFAMP